MLTRETINAVLQKALSTGADFAEIFVDDTVSNGISIIDGKVETAVSGRDFGVGIRLLKEFRRGGASPDNVSPETIENIQRSQLTERQLEVLEMVAGGLTYKETGAALGLTERTVKYHMEKIMEQLHFKKRAQVIAYAVQIGLIRG
jgi:DNA-binding CsgD family transcriptional regulator